MEVAKRLDTTIEIFQSNGMVSASLARCYVHLEGSFISAIGTGLTVRDAMWNLAKQIANREICNKHGAKLQSLEGLWIVLEGEVTLSSLLALFELSFSQMNSITNKHIIIAGTGCHGSKARDPGAYRVLLAEAGLTVIATSGSRVIAESGSVIQAFTESTITAKNGSKVYARWGSMVVAERGSTVYGKQGSRIRAETGSIVYAENESTVTAKNGSTVLARNGSVVFAEYGALVHSYSGSVVYAD
ncbi:MAG: hypothetical protein K8F91_18570, partial [Candidatus Obscuribacterales bacterium]|nr:hypothetical protein [Candidatus Obscuribacterales bacterium]